MTRALPGDGDPLAAFGGATRAWFARSFPAGATTVQRGGWPAIQRGEHALLCAPTGSGKTLAAFLACLDRLGRREATPGVRVLYVSPLKALAYDVERNLTAPLAGITAEAATIGEPFAQIRVATRTGDTSPRERRRLGRDPAEVLITTPESLYLLLGSEARRVLDGVETVIVDEIHALAPDKRGAHLMLSLERLSARVVAAGGKDPQRIGLSATQRPLDEMARFLGGRRPVAIIDAGERPRLDLRIEVPWGDDAAEDVWPALHARVLELISQHTSTIVFCNSRRLCERVAGRLNELWAEQGHADVLVRAHHGSLARDKRVEIEGLLKAGALRGIVATSSLELGIDMGAVDLVVQIESPGAVARGLQRVGRAGHSVGTRSQARVLPKFAQDLLEATVIARGMLDGDVEPVRVPKNPLDVLAQQIVAMTVEAPRSVDELEAIAHATYSFAALPRELLTSVLDMLAGRFPSTELADLRPRVVWDRTADVVSARKDARLIAIANAGTIPDRGLYGVYLDGDGPRVGELDEEMVYESRVGQVFLLGASSWRIVDITRDRVIVRPAPGEPGRMPFWRGEGPGRPIELGRAIGAFLREIEPKLEDGSAGAWLGDRYHLDERAAKSLVSHLSAQRATTGALPSDRTLVVERFRDELGDWRVCLHSPLGARVHAPLALLLEAALADRGSAQVVSADDGIVLRFADAEAPPSLRGLLPTADDVEELLLQQLRHSSLFASLFRQCAARALLLPRRRPGQRTPLWAQRLRAQTLLAVAGEHPSFPIVLETYRECLHDVFDVAALRALLSALHDGSVTFTEIASETPSPFARSLAFSYVATYLYEGDAPLAERKAQALALDRDLLRELLGEVSLRELLDPRALAEVEAELQGLAPERKALHADALHDLLRRIGDLGLDELTPRCDGDVATFLDVLARSGRALELGGRWLATEDAALYRDALGWSLPEGLPAAMLAPVPDALLALVARFARTHGPFTRHELAARFGADDGELAGAIDELGRAGRLLLGEYRPQGVGAELCDADVLRRIRRRTLAGLRADIAPVDGAALARFLVGWHGLAGSRGGPERLREAVRMLEGLPLSFAELEELLLPGRVTGFASRALDELGASGELVWIGHGSIGSDDGRVALYSRDHVERLAVRRPPFAGGALHELLRTQLRQRGACFFAQLHSAAPAATVQEVVAAIWELVWAGEITNDTFAPLRQLERLRQPLPGRWSLVDELLRVVPDETVRLHARALSLLERHGVVTREVAALEDLEGGFSSIATVLRAMEDAGRVRRGYFVAGLGGAQYALPGALDRLRSAAARADGPPLAMSAIDPANPFGLFLDWPEIPAAPDEAPARPRRVAGAIVVACGGEPVFYVEKGGRTLLLWRSDARLSAAVAALRETRRKPLQIAEINGRPALRSSHATAFERAGLRVEPGGLVLDPPR